jgi:hypothetical protein
MLLGSRMGPLLCGATLFLLALLCAGPAGSIKAGPSARAGYQCGAAPRCATSRAACVGAPCLVLAIAVPLTRTVLGTPGRCEVHTEPMFPCMLTGTHARSHASAPRMRSPRVHGHRASTAMHAPAVVTARASGAWPFLPIRLCPAAVTPCADCAGCTPRTRGRERNCGNCCAERNRLALHNLHATCSICPCAASAPNQ